MSDPNHPVWPLLRTVLRVAIVGACLAMFYRSVDARDLMTLVVVALSDPAIGAAVKPRGESE